MRFDAALAAGNCRSLNSQVGGADQCRPVSPFPARVPALPWQRALIFPSPASPFFAPPALAGSWHRTAFRFGPGVIFRAGARDGPT